jgi:pimeloyl-ACP methyl ester carboxylesterase
MHVFDGHFESLLPYYTVLTVDTRGHGKSSHGEKAFSYELFARDLFMLVNKLHIGNFLVLGFSDGANIALEFAVQHPERVAAMILVGGNISPSGLNPSVHRALQLQAAGSGLKGLFSKGGKTKKELLDLMLNHPHIEPSSLEKLSIPTLIITGENDVIKHEHSTLIATSLRCARHEVIAKASHFVMRDTPQEFDRLVLEFLMEDD